MDNVFRSIKLQSQGFSELENSKRKEFVASPNRKTQLNLFKNDMNSAQNTNNCLIGMPKYTF
jgi:hypothetical protein